MAADKRPSKAAKSSKKKAKAPKTLKRISKVRSLAAGGNLEPARLQAALRESIDKDIVDRIRAHQSEVASIRPSVRAGGQPPLVLLAHGDSWFDYPCDGNTPTPFSTSDIIAHLKKVGNPKPKILNLSHFGDATTDEMGLHKQKRLMRQQDLVISKETPAFRLVFGKETNSLEVWLPAEPYYVTALVRSRFTERDWGQRIGLYEFVRGALNGALKFDPLANRTVDISVALASTACFKCKKPIRVVRGLTVQGDRTCPEIGTFSFSLAELEEGVADAERWIEQEFPAARLLPYAVGPVKRRFSHTVQDRYLSNGCIHCGALQGRFYEFEVYDEKPIVIDARIKLTEPLLAACAEAQGVRRWWFDKTRVETDDRCGT
jgi:hypothetical protein